MANPQQSLSLVLPVSTDTSAGDVLYAQQINQVATAYTQFGPTTSRPVSNLFVGRTFFDTTLNASVTWNGTTWSTSTSSSFVVNPYSFIYGSSVGAVTSAVATNGQLLIGSTGAVPVVSTLTAGTGIGIANGAGSITVSNAGVTNIAAGTGISVSASTGSITITNTGSTAGVTQIIAGSGVTISPSGGTGAVTINSTGTFNPPLTMMYAGFSI